MKIIKHTKRYAFQEHENGAWWTYSFHNYLWYAKLKARHHENIGCYVRIVDTDQ